MLYLSTCHPIHRGESRGIDEIKSINGLVCLYPGSLSFRIVGQEHICTKTRIPEMLII